MDATRSSPTYSISGREGHAEEPMQYTLNEITCRYAGWHKPRQRSSHPRIFFLHYR